MGKAKKRNFDKCKNLYSMCLRRESVINQVISNFKRNLFGSETQNLISLFGLSPEELAEAGASWEELKFVDKLI